MRESAYRDLMHRQDDIAPSPYDEKVLSIAASRYEVLLEFDPSQSSTRFVIDGFDRLENESFPSIGDDLGETMSERSKGLVLMIKVDNRSIRDHTLEGGCSTSA